MVGHPELAKEVFSIVLGKVARWFIFKPKIPFFGNFGGTWNEKMLVYSLAIWSKLRPFGTFYGHLVI
jgi:hypothetical protein